MYPCLWFDNQAASAADFYCSVFGDGRIISSNPVVTKFALSSQQFMALNGGPQFKPTAAISFYAIIKSKSELAAVWEKLSDGGHILMPLDTYPWSELYGWVQDKYGISWQLAFDHIDNVEHQKFITTFMFCGAHQGKAETAVNFYVSLFKDTSLENLVRYTEGEVKGQVVFSRFTLNGVTYAAMDSGIPQPFTFSEAISQVIECDTQEEIDYYWNAFTKNGQESMCGWCRDEFGVWWQVVPAALGKLMSDPAKAGRVSEAFMQMKKFDIAALEAAAQ